MVKRIKKAAEAAEESNEIFRRRQAARTTLWRTVTVSSTVHLTLNEKPKKKIK